MGRLAAGAILLSLSAWAPARGDVLEIDPDGSIRAIAGPGPQRLAARSFGDVEGASLPDVAVPAEAIIGQLSNRAPVPFAAKLVEIAEANDLSPALLEALVWQESRWRHDAISSAGAIGLAQLMPATARSLGVDPRDPIQNLAGGARYLRQQLDLFDGDVEKALAAYNAGPGRVLKAGGIPPIRETRAYVDAIVGRLSTSPTHNLFTQGE
jgi:soluble lytic murein transglycosylase-like protein